MPSTYCGLYFPHHTPHSGGFAEVLCMHTPHHTHTELKLHTGDIATQVSIDHVSLDLGSRVRVISSGQGAFYSTSSGQT